MALLNFHSIWSSIFKESMSLWYSNSPFGFLNMCTPTVCDCVCVCVRILVIFGNFTCAHYYNGCFAVSGCWDCLLICINVQVEDIVDTGNTLCCLIAHLKSKGVSSVSVCTLLDKPSRRKVNFELVGNGKYYCGFEVITVSMFAALVTPMCSTIWWINHPDILYYFLLPLDIMARWSWLFFYKSFCR